MTTGSEHSAGPRELIRKPCLGAILLGLIPFLAICFSVPLWDRIYPMFFGIPFNLFWLILWIFLTPLCLWRAYRLERRREPPQPRGPRPEEPSR